MREYTRELVHHLHGMNFSDFSEKTVETARLCVEDFIGVALAGAEKKEAEIWRQYYAGKATAPEASVLRKGFGKQTVEQYQDRSSAPDPDHPVSAPPTYLRCVIWKRKRIRV